MLLTAVLLWRAVLWRLPRSVLVCTVAAAGSEEAPADGEGAAVEGGALTGACAYTSTNCNPIGNSSALMLACDLACLRGPLRLDLHTYKTYNALAADEPVKVSDTEYEVTLREGAKFSDGTDVTAADVVNAFEMNMADAHLWRISRVHRDCCR